MAQQFLEKGGVILAEALKNVVRTIIPRAVRNWLRSPSRSVEWLWDSAQFRFGVTKTLHLTHGWQLVLHPRAYKIIQRAQVKDKDQAREFQNFISYCHTTMVLFDIGAHFGVFSLAAAHFGGNAVAVDPSPTATRMVETLAGLNGFKNNIRIMRAAVSDVNGAMDMLSSGVFSDGYFKAAKGRLKAELTETKTVTIDQMTIQFGPPTHIKIDVEGYETAVLRGAKDTLSRFSPLLFLELHNEMIILEGADPNTTLDQLADHGYHVFALNGESISRDTILARPIIRVVAMRD